MPERREERTTEGGLNVAGGGARLQRVVGDLKDAGIRVSLFIEPDAAAVEASQRIGADIVELHTGAYCERALEGDAAARCRASSNASPPPRASPTPPASKCTPATA